MSEEITSKQAMDKLFHDYMGEVRSIAAECVAEFYDAETQEPRDEDEVTEWLEQTIDGHHDIIYTHCARLILVTSDNPDAYEDEIGEKPPTVEAAAYYALLTDVREMLGNRYFLEEECEKLAAKVQK